MSVATIETLPGVTPIVELGVGTSYNSTSTAQWDVDHWDDTTSAYWVGDQPYWNDVTCYVQDIATFAGRERATDQWEVGTATITFDNRDGLFDFPQSLADLADDSTLLSIRPGRSVRVGVRIGEGAKGPVYLWGGYIDAVNPQYDATDGSRMIVECIDAKGDAGRVDVGKLTTPIGVGETVTQRINRVLTAAGWPNYRRAIDEAGATMLATDLGRKCVDLMNVAADSAGGSVFGDPGAAGSDPRVVFKGRDFPNYDSDSPIAGTIGDFGYPGSPGTDASGAVELDEDPDGSGLYDPSPLTIDEDPDGSGLWQVLDSTTTTLDEDPDGSGLYDPAPLTLDEDPDGSGLWQVLDSDVEVIENPAGSGLLAIGDIDFTPIDIVEDPPGSGLFVIGSGLVPGTPPAPADTCPSSWELSFARADIATQVLLGRTGDTAPRTYPTATQLADLSNGTQYGLGMFGVESFKRTDLETQNLSDLDFLAERILTTRSWVYMPRVIAVTVTAKASAPQTYTTLSAASPYLPARFKCQHRVDGRDVFDRVMLVTGVEHSISPAGWEARISLDDALPYLVGGDHPARWDETDVALWDFATWARPI